MELTITVPRGILDAILEHARSESPSECCGLLSGLDHRVDLHHPLRNQASEPDKRYFAAPEDLFEAMREMRAEGRSLIAIYHSHPRGRAYPSETDIELAFYPHVACLIQALEPQPEIRAYRIVDRTVTEIRVEVVEAEWKQARSAAIAAAASAARYSSAEDFDSPAIVPQVEAPKSVAPPFDSNVKPVEKASIPEPAAEYSTGLMERVLRRVKSWF
ncbi:MAG: M67 family metallopeptidase [Acidobacteriota bacterium]|nr:MAG: M67 family metallopeptidase [Acidobacteriota bacterium]